MTGAVQAVPEQVNKNATSCDVAFFSIVRIAYYRNAVSNCGTHSRRAAKTARAIYAA